VERALAAAEAAPPARCFDERDRARLAAGTFSLERKDLIVGYAIERQHAPRNMLWWHIEGMTIHIVYTTFWSRQRREEAFERIATRMKTCHWGKAGGAGG